MIRVDAVWLALAPLDMRSGAEKALARVVNVFGSARPHHAYLFANRRANRLKVLVHDGIGIWLAARRLNNGKFVWPKDSGPTLTLTREQFEALVLGLPWQSRRGRHHYRALAVKASARAIGNHADVWFDRALAPSRSVIATENFDALNPEQLRVMLRSMRDEVARKDVLVAQRDREAAFKQPSSTN